jgi:succinoglycan biosynthesis transport protein ExoP
MRDEGERNVPDLRDYGRTVWLHRWLITATVVVAVGAAVGLSVIQTPVYQATAQLIIQRSSTLDTSQQDAQRAERNVDTETAVLRSRAVQDAAEAKLRHKPDISVSSTATSDVVSVSARSTNAERAAVDASDYAAVYVDLRRKQNIDDLVQAGAQVQTKIAAVDRRIGRLRVGSPEFTTLEQQRAFLQQQLDQLQISANLNQVGGARLLAEADVPHTPVSPKPVRNAAIAFLLGLLLGIGLAFLREYLDDTITSREDLERSAEELPVLGQIPRVAHWSDRETPYVVSLAAPHSPAAEGYRTLRTALQFLDVDHTFHSIQVTSAQTDEGKSTTLANLAVAFARAGRRVTIVCCDFRRPRIHEFFGLSNAVGFTSVMLGTASLFDALQRVPDDPNLVLLSTGPPPPNPSELLSSAAAREVIAVLEKSSDLVLVDSPPVLPVSDALIVSGMVDATLLVASAKASSRRGLHRSVEVLRQVSAPLVGTVLNNTEAAEGYGAYGYGIFEPAANGSMTRRQRRKAIRAAR